MVNIRNKAQKGRFALVGAIATAIDFIFLFLFNSLGVNRIQANYASTLIAFCFSFFANRKFTFRVDTGSKRKQLVLFFGVTFAGIWGIQPVIIWFSSMLLDNYLTQATVVLFFAKLLATGVTLLWNYFLYSRFVFPKEEQNTAS